MDPLLNRMHIGGPFASSNLLITMENGQDSKVKSLQDANEESKFVTKAFSMKGRKFYPFINFSR